MATLSALTATTALASADNLYVVDGANSRKITWGDVLDALEAQGAAPATFIASGTFADARIAASNVTQHEAALTLSAGQVSAAGALMDSEMTDLAGVKALDTSTLAVLGANTAANWTSGNPTLAAGQPGFETDTGYLKIGDGVTAWTSLGYVFNGGGGLAEGTSFPGSPSTNDRFKRTDRNLVYFYDGTRWLTEQQYEVHFQPHNEQTSSSDVLCRAPVPFFGVYSLYLEDVEFLGYLSTTGNWSLQIASLDPDLVTGTVVVSHTKSTAGFETVIVAIDALLPSDEVSLYLVALENSGSASCQISAILRYRLVG